MNDYTGRYVCKACGRVHDSLTGGVVIEKGALNRLCSYAEQYGSKRPFVLCDLNTYEAGDRVMSLLSLGGFSPVCHVIKSREPSADEKTVGESVMFCPREADLIIGVGGGVINDTCKILAMTKNIPMIIVGTAPSMDGFASATSSVEREGLKVSLPAKCPDCVIGDTEILAAAPKKLIISGIGDMLAKYVSLAEWKISHIINGEYYCGQIADDMYSALDRCVRNAPSAVGGDEDAVSSVMAGLVAGGVMMNRAGMSRPASGMEHYISHIIDMRSLEFGRPHSLHGIQCGTATLYTVRMYESLSRILSSPVDVSAAIRHAERYNLNEHNRLMREKLGRGAEAMIELERRERKYSPDRHRVRIGIIAEKREEIKAVIDSLPSSAELERLMTEINHPTRFDELGLNEEDIALSVEFSRDIRDKYVLSRLLWDLGIEKI